MQVDMPVTMSEFQKIFASWIEDDFFSPVDHDGNPEAIGPGPHSMSDFIHRLALGSTVDHEKVSDATYPDLTDLDKTFGDLLKESIRTESGDLVSVRQTVFELFCIEKVPVAALALAQSWDEETCKKVFRELRVSTFAAWKKLVNSEAMAHEIATVLFGDLEKTLHNRSLFSFFVREKKDGEFLADCPVISTFDLDAKKYTIERDGYIIELFVRNVDRSGLSSTVEAFEWSAQLFQGSADVADAAIVGTVYAFDRVVAGSPISLSVLLDAARDISEIDALQVRALLQQHSDAAEVIQTSDIGIVWMWERRQGTKHGLGADCLKLAVQHLRRRFRKLNTLFIDTRPSQFKQWNLPDPPMIEIAKQAAIEQLATYVNGISIPRVSVRHIFSSARALGDDVFMEEIFPQMASEADDTLDYEPYTDELAASFHHAGLLELADDIREGIADSAEIKRVLVRLLLHNRIPYLPAPFQLRDSQNPMDWINTAEIDFDDPDLEEFLDSLPPDVDVIRAFFCDAPGVEGWIVAVEIETEIGHLSDCFTLTPVPRSIDMSWLTSR